MTTYWNFATDKVTGGGTLGGRLEITESHCQYN